MDKVPGSIEDLIERRNKLRQEGQYEKADAIREEIEKEGYRVTDNKDGGITAERIEGEYIKPQKSFVVLFGSGEISPSGTRIHDYVFEKMGKDKISIALIATPAGFQPNVQTVYEEIAEHFQKHLKNYHPKVKIIYANTREEANAAGIGSNLENVDYIFTGPGSPTYAAKHLQDTVLYRAILQRVREGATLSLASAATAAFSRHCLPVYEIYKVGEALHWQEGLDLFRDVLEPMTIVPHFNNTEGGKKNDTSRCYMGKERFEKLLKLLPQDEKIIGIDEHTAVLFDLATKECIVRGKGSIHQVMQAGSQQYDETEVMVCKK